MDPRTHTYISTGKKESKFGVDIERAREVYAKYLHLKLPQQQALNGFVPELDRVLAPFREGGTPILLDYHNEQGKARVVLGEQWRVRPSDELLSRLRQLLGEEQVRRMLEAAGVVSGEAKQIVKEARGISSPSRNLSPVWPLAFRPRTPAR